MNKLCRKRNYWETNKEKPRVLTTYLMKVNELEPRKSEYTPVEVFNEKSFIPSLPNNRQPHDDENYHI